MRSARKDESLALLKPREVARILDVSVGTLREWRRRDRLRGPDFIKLGSRPKAGTRYALAAVRRYLLARTVRIEGDRES